MKTPRGTYTAPPSLGAVLHHAADPVRVGLHAGVEAGDGASADHPSQADDPHQLVLALDVLG